MKDMKKTMYAIIAGAGLMVAGMMSAAAETVVIENVPNGTEVAVVAGPKVDSLKKLIAQLHLTKVQKQKIHAILAAADVKFEAGMQQADKNSDALMALAMTTDYDAAKVATLADAQGKLVASAIELRLSVHHQIAQVLTQAQKDDLKKFAAAQQ